MRYTFNWLLLAVLTVGSSLLYAQMIEVTGQAVIYNNDLVDARYRATQQALKQAVLQANAEVVTKDSLINGEVESYSTLAGVGRTKNTEILSETRNGDILTVVVLADVTPDDVCSNGTTNRYRKSIGITSFALQSPQQANLGAIHSMPRLLPADVTKEINREGVLNALTATNIQLYPDLVNAPTSTNYDGSLTHIAQVGQSLGVQYVMTGVIRDTGSMNAETPNYERKFNNFSPITDPSDSRDIGIDIYLYDGFSGALLFQQSYHEMGEWDLDRFTKTGYGTLKFWQTKYGQSVKQVLRQIALDASSKLKCQPFMANIFRVEGNRVHIDAGSTAGIKVGQTLSAYRRYEVFNQLQNPLTQLNNANIEVKIKQVQPNFSIGELDVDAQILNLQQQDVIIAW